MSASLSLLKFNALRWLTLPLHRKFHRTVIVQSNFDPSIYRSDALANKSNGVWQNPLELILNTVPPESDALSPNDTLNIIRNLSEASMKLSQLSTTYNVINHKNFQILREAIKISFPYLLQREKLDILDAIRALSVPIDDDISNAVLSSLLENVFKMSLDDIMILDQILIPWQENRLAAKLHRHIVDQFNVKCSQPSIKFNYFMKTRRILRFIERNRDQIIEEVFLNMEKCAKKNEIDILTTSEAFDVIIALSSFGDRTKYFWQILNKAFVIWSIGQPTFGMVEMLLQFLLRRRSLLSYSHFKNSRLIETCAQIAIESGDIEKCFIILRHLNRLEFTTKRLIDFLLECLKNKTDQQNFIVNCITICIACDIGNYRPPLFNEFLYPLLSKMNFHQQLDVRLNWPKFALRLHRFGIHHQLLIGEILKQRSHFETFDKDSIGVLECIEIERLVNANVQNLLPVFRQNIHENLSRLIVYAENGVIIPLLVKIDTHSRNLVSFGEKETNLLQSIQCNDNQCLVALVRSSFQDVRPFRPDVVTIILDASEWVNLLQHKNEQTLITQIDDHLKNARKNESVSMKQPTVF